MRFVVVSNGYGTRMQSNGSAPQQYDIGVIGGGSATEALAIALREAGLKIVVFEAERVGGECPFVACIPSKTLLHDAATTGDWDTAVAHRDEATNHLDDSSHALDLERTGAVLVRARASVIGPQTIEAAGVRFDVSHIVLATGSEPIIPELAGLDSLGDRLWTTIDATTAHERPGRLAILGGGVIGCELAHAFAGFGSIVTLIDEAPLAFPDLADEVGVLIDEGLAHAGVSVRRATRATRCVRADGCVRIELDTGDPVIADRVLVAVGRRARVSGLGLESIGIDPSQELDVDDRGRVRCAGSVWAMGDVAGRGQYTHVANHQARVVANQLAGDGTRRFDDVVTSSCVFTDPPLIQVGATRQALEGDPDVVWATGRVADLARAVTDDLAEGFLAVAARRSTRTVVAAHGAGPRFEELVHALVIAVDGDVRLDRLAMSMHAFPTVGEILEPIFGSLARAVALAPATHQI
jgi:dihydrolipoamide dehydrogenase